MRIPVWMVALAAAAMFGSAVGCSGGGDDDDDDDDDGSSLQSGTYLLSNGATSQDQCDSLGDLSGVDGLEVEVTATATTVTFEDFFTSPVDHDLVGSTFSVGGTSQYDWTDPATWQAEGLSGPYNCVENDVILYEGTITSPTSFSYEMSVMYTLSSGDAAQCQLANNSAGYAITAFPCTSEGGFDGAI